MSDLKMDPKTQMDLSQVVSSLAAIAGALNALVNGPMRANKPAGDGLLKTLERLTSAVERLEKKIGPDVKS